MTLPSRVFLLFVCLYSSLPTLAQMSESESKGRNILGQAVAASGAADVQGFTATGTMTYFWAGQAIQSNATIRAKGGDQFRIDADVPGGRGIFQIEGNGVSDADAFDPIKSMEWSAAEARRFLDSTGSTAETLGIDPYALAALNHNLGDPRARGEINRVLGLGLSGPAALLQLNLNRASGAGSSLHAFGVMGMMACFGSTD